MNEFSDGRDVVGGCKYKCAEVKFNDGRGALLCNKCSITICPVYVHDINQFTLICSFYRRF